jgi:hypothetical protein
MKLKNILITILTIVTLSATSCSARHNTYRINCKGLKAHPDYEQKFK